MIITRIIWVVIVINGRLGATNCFDFRSYDVLRNEGLVE